MSSPLHGEAVLLLGASGFLGRVIAARLLTDSTCPLVLPVRARHTPETIHRSIAEEHPSLTVHAVRDRTTVVTLPEPLTELLPLCQRLQVRGIVNCAGSVSYHDRVALRAGNEGMTAGAIALGQALEVAHFTYVSTAFSSGYVSAPVPEALHAEPPSDPTDYTASKRACEHLVARSGLPFLIARPSIVIGDSRSGRYSGKPYGVYQLWRAFERLLAHEWQETSHAIASNAKLQLVHQDAVADGMVAALHQFEPGRIVHLVSDPERLPTVRQAWQQWFDRFVRPRSASFHSSMEQAAAVPMSRRQRVYLDFSATNLEIAEHDWSFQTNALADLGLPLPVADGASLGRCQDAYVAQSPALTAYAALSSTRSVTWEHAHANEYRTAPLSR